MTILEVSLLTSLTRAEGEEEVERSLENILNSPQFLEGGRG